MTMNGSQHRFKNKRALVTGASSGIGLAIAQALAAEGAHIHAVARSWPKPLKGGSCTTQISPLKRMCSALRQRFQLLQHRLIC